VSGDAAGFGKAHARETFFTRAEARAHDRHLIEACGIPGIALMERAARGCAELARGMLAARGGVAGARVEVHAGPGQNGGDGYEIARLLAADGARVEVVALGEPRRDTDAAITRARAVAAGVPIRAFDASSGGNGAPPDLVVDALFGTGLDRPLAGESLAAVQAVDALATSGAPVLSVDLPSGMDCDTGAPLPMCVRATVTATMAAPKAAFKTETGAACAGVVRVVPLEDRSDGAVRGGA
jgi:hydroxyethylthiazole kinase-like uncharacterized protein yjeF